jgi:hypothetical protein
VRASFTLTVIGKVAMNRWAIRGQNNINRKATLGSLIRRRTAENHVVVYK